MTLTVQDRSPTARAPVEPVVAVVVVALLGSLARLLPTLESVRCSDARGMILAGNTGAAGDTNRESAGEVSAADGSKLTRGGDDGSSSMIGVDGGEKSERGESVDDDDDDDVRVENESHSDSESNGTVDELNDGGDDDSDDDNDGDDDELLHDDVAAAVAAAVDSDVVGCEARLVERSGWRRLPSAVLRWPDACA
jgi:hypothetical protein